MASAGSGLCRFAADLPAVERFIGLGEGGTPVLELATLAAHIGVRRVFAKLESYNPSGSYKDRVAAMSASLAVQRKNDGWIGTSSGNAGLAMAAYCTQAGLPGFLCLVSSAPLEKRLPLLPYPVEVIAVKGIGRQSTAATEAGLLQQVAEAAQDRNLFLGITAHAFNPDGMRGIDTLAYELAEQAPDATHVYVPVGGGGLLTAIARGLRRRAMPARVIACQPVGCAPVVRFLNGEITAPEITRCGSDISALQIPRPPDGLLAAEAVAASDGWGTAVDDDGILAAQRLLVRTEGVFVEPAAAAGIAALLADVERNRVRWRDHVVLVLTGAGWKDLARFADRARVIPLVQLSDVAASIENWFTATLQNQWAPGYRRSSSGSATGDPRPSGRA